MIALTIIITLIMKGESQEIAEENDSFKLMFFIEAIYSIFIALIIFQYGV